MNRKSESRIAKSGTHPNSELLFVATLSCFCLFASAAFAPAQANPLKGPRRTIDQHIVDLHPLFQWWTNRAGERPLEAWVHITGHIVGTNSWGWVLTAHIEEAVHAKGEATDRSAGKIAANIILKNPPRADQAEFENLEGTEESSFGGARRARGASR